MDKDTVSRVWRKVRTDWDAWNARSLVEEPIVRLILDGTVARRPRRSHQARRVVVVLKWRPSWGRDFDCLALHTAELIVRKAVPAPATRTS